MPISRAQLGKKICYYFSNPTHNGTGEILMGLPEQYAAPVGFEKIVCTSVAEAERWSGRMRVWEEAKEKIAQAYQRHQEEQQIEAIRSDFRTKIANARNAVNRDFLVQSLANFEKRYEDRFAMERTSFLHLEGYDEGDKTVAKPKYRQPHNPFRGGA